MGHMNSSHFAMMRDIKLMLALKAYPITVPLFKGLGPSHAREVARAIHRDLRTIGLRRSEIYIENYDDLILLVYLEAFQKATK